MAAEVHHPRRGFRLLGVEIDRKTDVLAAAAFVISVAGVLYQVISFLEGPKIVQLPPEQLLLFAERNAADGNEYLHIGAQVAYVNNGKEGKNAALKSERVVFQLGGKLRELRWQTFDKFSSDNGKLNRGERTPALPVVVKAGEGISHETNFSPRTLHVADPTEGPKAYENFMPWTEFVSQLSKVNEFEVRLISEFYGLKSCETKLFVRVTPDLIENLRTKNWSGPSCWPKS
jgi:hypothetical protein